MVYKEVLVSVLLVSFEGVLRRQICQRTRLVLPLQCSNPVSLSENSVNHPTFETGGGKRRGVRTF